MNATLQEIGQWVSGSVSGDLNLIIHDVAAIEDAKEGEISFVDHMRHVDAALKSSASAFCTSPSIAPKLQAQRPLVIVDRPRIAFAELVRRFRPKRNIDPGIHPAAMIEHGASFGKDVSIGAGTFIGTDAMIGDRTQIHAQAYVGRGVRIGADCIVYPHAVLIDDITVGSRVIVHAGAVIGSDGFGYEQAEGKHLKVPQVGTVIIEDDVEIGANTTIDRAALSATIIGEGTKIDNLVQVGHNSKIGKHCVIAGQAGMAGGVVIEDGVMIGGQAGFQPQSRTGRGAKIGGQSGVISDVPAGAMYSGHPAGPHGERMRAEAALKRLPELIKQVRRLEKEVRKLQLKLDEAEE